MRKQLLSLFGALLVAAPTFAQFTAADLNGKCVDQIFTSDPMGWELPINANSGTFLMKDANTVILQNFWCGMDLEVKIENGNLVVYDQKCTGKYDYAGYTLSVASMGDILVNNRDNPTLVCYEQGSGKQTAISHGQTEINGTYSPDAVTYSLDAPIIIECSRNGSTYAVRAFDQVVLYIYEPNTTADEYVGNRLESTYNVWFKFNDDKTFTIRNFGNLGAGFENNVSSWSGNNVALNPFYNGTYDVENWTVTLPSQFTSSDSNFSNPIGWLTQKGCYGYWFEDCGNYYWYYSPYAFRGVDGTDIYDARPVEGTFEPSEIAHNNTEENMWISDGGKVTTGWENVDVTFGFSQVVDLGEGTRLGYADKTVINDVVLPGEHTLQVALNVENATYDKDSGLALSGKIKTAANDKFVDSYELFMVEGHYDSVAGNPDFNHENGHANATNIDSFVAGNQSTLAANGADRTFNLVIPTDLINKEGEGKYSLFVKANYANESGLEPTFHALTPITFELPEEEESGNTAIVTIGAESNPVRYFNLQGVEIANPEKGQVVIMRQGNKSQKIVVR